MDNLKGKKMNSYPHIQCCICLETYIDPVSIPCGHNFCLDCIQGYWNNKTQPECPLCKQRFSRRPLLKINKQLTALIDYIKKLIKEEQAPEEEYCNVCSGRRSTESCVACQRRDRRENCCEIHHRPLTLFCRQDSTLLCTKCSEDNHKHHDTVALEKERRRLKTRLRETKNNIQEMIQAREGKKEEIQNTVETQKNNTEMQIQKSAQFCSVLIQAIQQQQASLVQDLETQQREAETRAHQLLDELNEEIEQLEAKDAELQLLESNHSSTHILQLHQSLADLPTSRKLSEVPLHSDVSTGTVRKAFSKLLGVYQEITNQLAAEEMEKIKQHAVSITLDPQTAAGWLVLSSDGKEVSCQKKYVALTDTPQRFDSCVCILGKQRFTSGRHYWVVQVGDKTDWDLGLASESINRKGTITVRPDKGFWAISRRKGGNLSACTSPYVTINLQEIPKKVGVFLDYEEGSVSFFNADTKTHIYTFSGFAFNKTLYPYFNPCIQENGKNMSPLIICPLNVY